MLKLNVHENYVVIYRNIKKMSQTWLEKIKTALRYTLSLWWKNGSI